MYEMRYIPSDKITHYVHWMFWLVAICDISPLIAGYNELSAVRPCDEQNFALSPAIATSAESELSKSRKETNQIRECILGRDVFIENADVVANLGPGEKSNKCMIKKDCSRLEYAKSPKFISVRAVTVEFSRL